MQNIPIIDTIPFELWLDLDGVMADFDGKYHEIAGHWPHEAPSKNRLWSKINSQKDFFYSLELMHEAEYLWTYFKQYNPIFLTGLPSMSGAKDQKIQWVAEKFGPQYKTIVLPKKEKQLYAGPNKVLVDDTESNIEQWISKGGIGILHKCHRKGGSVWNTIQALEDLRKQYQ